MQLVLRPIIESDIALLHCWLGQPHLCPWYVRDDVSLAAVRSKYLPRVDESHAVSCAIAALDDAPFGFAQWYLNRDFPDYGEAVIGMTEGVSIDYYVGDPACLGRSLGSRMLVGLVEQILPQLEPRDRLFCIGHDKTNARAIRCTMRAGFAPEKDFVEDGVESTLFTRRDLG